MAHDNKTKTLRYSLNKKYISCLINHFGTRSGWDTFIQRHLIKERGFFMSTANLRCYFLFVLPRLATWSLGFSFFNKNTHDFNIIVTEVSLEQLYNNLMERIWFKFFKDLFVSESVELKVVVLWFLHLIMKKAALSEREVDDRRSFCVSMKENKKKKIMELSCKNNIKTIWV